MRTLLTSPIFLWLVLLTVFCLVLRRQSRREQAWWDATAEFDRERNALAGCTRRCREYPANEGRGQ